MHRFFYHLVACIAVLVCTSVFASRVVAENSANHSSKGSTVTEPQKKQLVVAGGCFWCLQPPYDRADGVLTTESGYIGGTVPNPTYEQVSEGDTGHVEAIRITYDPNIITVDELLTIFWKNINPTQDDGQFADRGPQYWSAIFYADEAEKTIAEASKERLAKSGKFNEPIATTIRPLDTFYLAEVYHQGYYKKNPARYGQYSVGSGRKGFIEKTWGKDSAVSEQFEKAEKK